MAQIGDEEEIQTVPVSPWAIYRVAALVGIAIALVGTIVYLLSEGGQELFQRRVVVRTFLPDGTGVEKKAAVELNGIQVGRVKSVRLSGSTQAGREVVVDLGIEQRYLSAVPVDSRTEVTADNLLGDKYVNIHKGISPETVKPDDELLAAPVNTNFDPADLMASLQTILKQANTTLDQMEDPSTTVGALVQGDALYQLIRSDIAAMQNTIHSFGNPKSPLGQAVYGHDLYDQLRAPILDLDKTLASIQSGEGVIGHALVSSDQYDQLRDGIAGFNKSVAAFRKNDYMSKDDLYESANASLRSLAGVIDSFAAGPLFTQTQLYESLNGSTRSTAQFLSEFRKNPQKFLRIKVF